MNATIERYLADFSAGAPSPAPPQSGLVVITVGAAQQVLRDLGDLSIIVDNKYGPKTRDAWQAAAMQRKLNPAFDRRGGTEVWVHPDTYYALQQQGIHVATTPIGMHDASVLALQDILLNLGQKLKRDGRYGNQTATAWAASSKLRKLDPRIVRVDAKTARVSAATYVALRGAKPATAATVARAAAPLAAPVRGTPVRTPSAPAAAVTAAPAGTQDAPVLELQDILYSLGWTAKKLKRDGLYGKQTATAWATSSRLRKLDPRISRVDGKTARVSAATYAALKTAAPATAATVAAAAAPSAPSAPSAAATPSAPSVAIVAAPSGMANAAVLDLQDILYSLGWTQKKLKRDGLYGKQTANAWTISSKLRKLDPRISRVDGKTARVSAATLAALQAAKPATAAMVAAAAPPGTVPAPGDEAAAAADVAAQAPSSPQQDAINAAADKIYTAPVLVGDMQRTFVVSTKYPNVTVTGSWDNATEGAYLDWTQIAKNTPAEILPLFVNALHTRLVSPDQQSVKVTPNAAKIVAAGASLYASKQASGAIPQSAGVVPQTLGPGLPSGGEPTSITPTMVAPPSEAANAATAAAAVAAAQQQQMMPQQQAALMPSGGGITPEPQGPPVPSDQATPPSDQAAPAGGIDWPGMVQALATIGDDARKFGDALEAASKRGELHPDVKAAALAWAQSADALKGDVAKLVDGSAPLKSALEANASSVGLAGGLSALDRLFGGFGAVTDQVLTALKTPIPTDIGGKALQGFGLGDLGFVQWIIEVGEVVWPKVVQLLGTRAVTAVGVTAAAASGLDKVINGDVQGYQQHESDLAKMVADGKLTVAEYNALKQSPPGGGSNFGTLVLGAVAVAGIALLLKHKRSTGSRMKQLRAA